MKTQPGKFSLVGGGLTIGHASGEPITGDFQASIPGRFPAQFSG